MDPRTLYSVCGKEAGDGDPVLIATPIDPAGSWDLGAFCGPLAPFAFEQRVEGEHEPDSKPLHCVPSNRSQPVRPLDPLTMRTSVVGTPVHT